MKLSTTSELSFIYDEQEVVFVYTKPSVEAIMQLEEFGDNDGVKIYSYLISKFFKSWNLEDDDNNIIPLTVEAAMQVPIDFMKALLEAWGEKVTGVPIPLGQPLNAPVTLDPTNTQQLPLKLK